MSIFTSNIPTLIVAAMAIFAVHDGHATLGGWMLVLAFALAVSPKSPGKEDGERDE